MSRRLNLKAVLTIVCFSLLPAGPGFAVEIAVTPTQGQGCKSTSRHREESFLRCAGPFGYGFTYFDHVMAGHLAFGHIGKEGPSDLGDLSWRPSANGIGSRIEWRRHNERSVTAILSRWRGLEDGSSERVVQELFVVKVLPNGGCALGVVAAFAPDAMKLARNIADERGPSFRCGVDKPMDVSGLATGEVDQLDRRFAKREILEHNESIVELNRTRAGTIDIRYREPRAALKIKPGQLLFEGQEHNGRIEGRAFVFMDGCAPAPYDVTGRRTDGILVLEGKAPRRGKGCAVIGDSATSQHAWLAFAYEPILDAARDPETSEAELRHRRSALRTSQDLD